VRDRVEPRSHLRGLSRGSSRQTLLDSVSGFLNDVTWHFIFSFRRLIIIVLYERR